MIHFSCKCDRVYHASKQHIGYFVSCPCGHRQQVPPYSTVDYREEPPPPPPESVFTPPPQWTTSAAPLKKKRRPGPAFWLILYLVFCLCTWRITQQWLVPVLAAATGLAIGACRRSRHNAAKAAVVVLMPTAAGLSLLLMVHSLLVLLMPDTSTAPPPWLLSLDEWMTGFRETLEMLEKGSILVWVALIPLVMLYGRSSSPLQKPATHFSRLKTWSGRMGIVLLVFTSFSFWAPSVIDTVLEQGWTYRYKVARRLKARSEQKKQLLAIAVRELRRPQAHPPIAAAQQEALKALIRSHLEQIPGCDTALSPAATAQLAARHEIDQWVYQAGHDYLEKGPFQNYPPSSAENGRQQFEDAVDAQSETEWKAWKKENRGPEDLRAHVAKAEAEAAEAAVQAEEAVKSFGGAAAEAFGNALPDEWGLFKPFLTEIFSLLSEQHLKKARLTQLVRSLLDGSYYVHGPSLLYALVNFKKMLRGDLALSDFIRKTPVAEPAPQFVIDQDETTVEAPAPPPIEQTPPAAYNQRHCRTCGGEQLSYEVRCSVCGSTDICACPPPSSMPKPPLTGPLVPRPSIYRPAPPLPKPPRLRWWQRFPRFRIP